MPVMNGLEALQRATSEGTRRQALVFMMTTETNAELKALGKELGLNGWIVKPVVIEPIVAFTVKKLSSGAA
jgi:two-component system chemotaxis response regulator CheY